MEFAMARPRSQCPCQSTRIFSPGRLHHFLEDEPHQRECSHRRGMSGGIANHDGARPAVDRGRVKTLHHLRIAAARVLGDVHRFEAQRHGELHGFFRGLKQEVVGPAFGVAANRTGANEGRGLNVQPGALHDLGDRPDVILVGAGGAVGANLHLVADDLAGQRLAIRDCARSGAGQSQIERVDAQGFHQMQDLNFLCNRGIAHRRRLQPIAQGLIVEQDLSRRAAAWRHPSGSSRR